MKRALLLLTFTVAVGASLFGAAYWGQLYALKSSTKIEAAYIHAVRIQADCIDLEGWDCVRFTQKAIADMLAARMSVLQQRSLIDDNVAADVKEYLGWHELSYASE